MCVFLFVIEEREVENGELEKKGKEEYEKKMNKKFRSKIQNISFSHFEQKIEKKNFEKINLENFSIGLILFP